MGSKSWEEGEIGLESRKKGDLLPCFSPLPRAGRESDLTCLVDQKNGDRMIKQLLSLVNVRYRDLSFSRISLISNYLYLICLPLTNHDILLNLTQ